MARDWKNEKDYDYMDNHTPELWAWEFLRRNPEYRKDWDTALAIWKKNNKSDAPNYWAPLFGSSCSEENHQPDTLSFSGARSKWGLYIDEIINPDIDKPLVEYPYSLFYTYDSFYEKDDFHLLPELNDLECVTVFDLAKPIQQQLEHFKSILEDYQSSLAAYTELEIPKVKNKSIYWKDYIRILDAYEANAEKKDIASVIFPEKTNTHPEYYGNETVRDSLEAAEKIRDENYRKILQKPSQWKKR